MEGSQNGLRTLKPKALTSLAHYDSDDPLLGSALLSCVTALPVWEKNYFQFHMGNMISEVATEQIGSGKLMETYIQIYIISGSQILLL